MTQLEDEDEQECVIEGDNCLICNTQVGEDDIYKDERSDLEKARDIVGILQGYVESPYRDIVNKYISREASIPEVNNCIYRSKQELRKVCAAWRKNQKSELLDQINSDATVNSEYQNYIREVSQDGALKEKIEKISINLASLKLHQLPLCNLFITSKDGIKRMYSTAVDSCATNFLLGLDLMTELGYSENDINSKNKYKKK